MPRQGECRFRRDVVNGSQLNYATKMIFFYSSMLDDLSRKIGEETEYGVIVTEHLLETIEERLSYFENMEKEIVALYRKNVLSKTEA